MEIQLTTDKKVIIICSLKELKTLEAACDWATDEMSPSHVDYPLITETLRQLYEFNLGMGGNI